MLFATLDFMFCTFFLSSIASATSSTSDHGLPSLIMFVSLAVGTAEGLTIECVLKNCSMSLSACSLGLGIAVQV